MTGTLADLVRVPELARMKGVPYRTLLRDLLALWNADVAEGGGDWLLRLGRRKKMWVNLSRLRAAHPVLFDARAVDRSEFESLRDAVEKLALAGKELKRGQKAVAANLNDVRRALKQCQTMPDNANGRPSS